MITVDCGGRGLTVDYVIKFSFLKKVVEGPYLAGTACCTYLCFGCPSFITMRRFWVWVFGILGFWLHGNLY